MAIGSGSGTPILPQSNLAVRHFQVVTRPKRVFLLNLLRDARLRRLGLDSITCSQFGFQYKYASRDVNAAWNKKLQLVDIFRLWWPYMLWPACRAHATVNRGGMQSVFIALARRVMTYQSHCKLMYGTSLTLRYTWPCPASVSWDLAALCSTGDGRYRSWKGSRLGELYLGVC
jgi:hypothetical protein